MSNKIPDILIKMRRMSMDLVLPQWLSNEMRNDFLNCAERMTPKQIAEVGEKFKSIEREAFEKWKEQKEHEKISEEVLFSKLGSK